MLRSFRVECPSDAKSSGSFKDDDQGKALEDKQSRTAGRISEPVEDFRINKNCVPPAPDPQGDDAVFTSDGVFLSASDSSDIDTEQFMVSSTGGYCMSLLLT